MPRGSRFAKTAFIVVASLVGIFSATALAQAVFSAPPQLLQHSGQAPRLAGLWTLVLVYIVGYIAFIKHCYRKLFSDK